jgi:cytochrome P450
MSVEEILCQISTFMAAGHETSASALTWCLYALARSPRAQSTLRAHLLSIPLSTSTNTLPEEPSLEDHISRLPYLDYVVREALRVHAPVTTTMRVCARDRDEIPVERSFVDREGNVRNVIEVRRHDIVSVPIQAINRNERVWGADAAEFR